MVVFSRNRTNPQKEIKDFIIENITIINNLIAYFNENLKKLGKMYKCVYPGIYDYTFVNNIETYTKLKMNEKLNEKN